MKYLQPSFTMPPAEPNPEMCCEACAFGSGAHADFCQAKAAVIGPFAKTIEKRRHSAIESIALALDQATRYGADVDTPEGTRWIIMSDTLAKRLSTALREMADEFRHAPRRPVKRATRRGDNS
jgi:hypothetical protein